MIFVENLIQELKLNIFCLSLQSLQQTVGKNSSANKKNAKVETVYYTTTDCSDLLKAPEKFPMPDERYTLCEMNVTWAMYGGHDFEKENHKENL